ncbi:MAG: carboxypeptidase-like regulatory domain-containing protein [Acidimicrobiales bacterium]
MPPFAGFPLFKAVAGAAAMATMFGLWTIRGPVVAAYQNTGPSVAPIQLDGIDLAIEPTAIEPSPFAVADPPPALTGTETVVGAAPPPPEVAVTGGDSTITGTVSDGSGPVAGATVRLERHTITGAAELTVATDATGRWRVGSALGGRYRIRAWRSGSHASTGSSVLFVDAGSVTEVATPVVAVDTTPFLTIVDSGTMYTGLSATVAVTVAARTVDDAGAATISGLPGVPVTLSSPSGLIITDLIRNTDGAGVARFSVRCQQPGAGTVQATVNTVNTVNTVTASAALPSCLAVPGARLPAAPPVEPPVGAVPDGVGP